MVGWRRSARFALVITVLAVGGAVFVGLRDRVEPARALVVERADPDAVIQTRGSRIVQADAQGENLQVTSGIQSTYADGAMKLSEGVEVTVADREGRSGFGLVGEEATVDSEQTIVHMTGNVRMSSSGGLHAETADARYTDADGVVRMPGATRFRREHLLATGEAAEYDRTSDELRLSAGAMVDLIDDGTRIESRSATLSLNDGQMDFEGAVRIARGEHRMTAREARVSTDVDTNVLEALDLAGQATIAAARAEAGGLQEMTARELSVAYVAQSGRIDRATLTGDARLQLVGAPTHPGSRVTGSTMEIRFGEDGAALEALLVKENVLLTVPTGSGRPAQLVAADVLTVSSTSGVALDTARFEGDVEYREFGPESGDAPARRVTRAERLEATLGKGLAGLLAAHFLGNVVFEDGDTVAEAVEASYDVALGEIELMSGDNTGESPRLESGTHGSIQAEAIVLGLDDGRISARGQVESVLAGITEGEETGLRRPGMLEARESVYVTANALEHDDAASLTTYSGGAHLWQSTAKFDGEEIILDEQNGNIGATGNVRTESMIVQVNDETGLPEESLTRGAGQRFTYDDGAHEAWYEGKAGLRWPRGDLRGDGIRVFLHEDGRTLRRIEAQGDVELDTADRWVTGGSLVYRDADGRYEMEGEPVRIIERTAQGCRETTGRRVTFFITDDAVSVDGESEVRTEAARVPCPPGAGGG